MIKQNIIARASVGYISNSLHLARTVCADLSPQTSLSVPRSEQFSDSVPPGNLWAFIEPSYCENCELSMGKKDDGSTFYHNTMRTWTALRVKETICPCANDIVYARFEGTFSALRNMGKCSSRHLFFFWRMVSNGNHFRPAVSICTTDLGPLSSFL